MSHDAKYEFNQVKEELVGGKILKAFISPHDEYFGFLLEKDGKCFEVWIDSDQEGNDCGSISINECKDEIRGR